MRCCLSGRCQPRRIRTNNNSAKLRKAVTVEGILEHESALQAIADAAEGNRLSGTPGYDDSAEYVAARAAAAGYNVEVQEFEYVLDLLADYERPILSIEGGTEFVAGIAGASLGGDFGSMYKSTPYSIDITAPVWAIDLALPAVGPPNTSTSGCRGRGLCRCAGGRDHHRPARHLFLRPEVHAR